MILTSIFAVATSTAETANNKDHCSLVTSCDFDKSIPSGLVLKNAQIVERGGRSGSKALKLAGTGSGGEIKGIRTNPGQRYKLSYHVKAGEKVLTDTGCQYFRVYVSWDNLTSRGMEWLDTLAVYQKKELIFTAPTRDYPKGMTIHCEINDAGTLFLDDLYLEALPPEKEPAVRIHINMPFYRNTIYNSTQEKEINGYVSVDVAVSSVSLTLCKEGEVSSVFNKTFYNIEKSFPFAIPADDLKYGKYILSIIPVAQDGSTLEKIQTPIWKLEKSPVEIVCRNDLNFYINGKIFYPIILWGGLLDINMTSDNLRRFFYCARKKGFNTFMVSAGGRFQDILYLLDIAKNFDCKIILATGNLDRIDYESIKNWKHNLLNKFRSQVLSHEAFAGYFLTDEPMWRGVALENLLASYEIIKEIDPYRPIWINEAPRGALNDLKKYSAAADIWGVDIYPVPSPSNHSALNDKGPTSVGKYTQISIESVEMRKPVWMALQGFAWGALPASSRKLKIYPDEKQSCFMAFDCIVNGAQGISYWGTQFIDDSSFWNVLFNTTEKLAMLSGVIVLPEIQQGKITSDNCAIRFCAKENAGNVYIIAVNESATEVDVKFRGLSEITKVSVVFENREITCKSNSFSDKFMPYGTHVYASGKLPDPVVKPIETDKELDKEPSIFDEYVKGKSMVRKYDGKAKWIWFPGENTTPLSRAAFKKEFTVDELPVTAKIIITADDHYVLWVNGNKVSEDNDWSTAESYDLKTFLKKGPNTIYVEAADEQNPPSAFLADILLVDSKGNKKNIVTDDSWSAKKINEFSGPDVIMGGGINAENIADYGKGPWRNGVSIK